MLIIVLLLVFGLCLGIFNYWFQHDKYKRLSEEEIKRQSVLNSPRAWIIYSIIFFIALISCMSYLVYQYYLAVFRLYQNTN